MFVPADAAIEGGSADDPDPDEGDRHVITVRRDTCDLIELYAAERVRDASGAVVAWRAASAARWPPVRPLGLHLACPALRSERQHGARPVDGRSLEVVKPWRRVVTC